MEVMHCDFSKIKDEGVNFVIKRGTTYDKLQYDMYCRLYDDHNRNQSALVQVSECVVISFRDIESYMVYNAPVDHLLKDMMTEHPNFRQSEIVTIVYFTIYHKY